MSRADAAPHAAAIDDSADPRLAPYADIRERDLVGRRGRFIVEGEVTLRVLLGPSSRYRAESILLLPERRAAFGTLLDDLPGSPPVMTASRAVIAAVAGFPIHRGVLALARRGVEPDPDALIPAPPAPAIVLALVGLTNHDNVGACFRNAAAFGADAVLTAQGCCDPLYRKAIRVSAGAALTMPFAATGGADLIALAHRHALVPLALTPGASESVGDTVLPARALVLLGTEGRGLPPGLIGAARALRVDMAPGFDSLNVATAGAIVLHHLHAARLRRHDPPASANA